MRQLPRGPRLRRDIDEAADLYEWASAELAMTFLTAFGEAPRLLWHHPAIGSPRYGQVLYIHGLRCIQTSTFPYLLFCQEQDRPVRLARWLHLSRDIGALLPRP